jgi:hypothetical protein
MHELDELSVFQYRDPLLAGRRVNDDLSAHATR